MLKVLHFQWKRRRIYNFFVAHSNPDESVGLGKMFSDPNIFAKLAGNPRTAKHLADPAFMQKVIFSRPSDIRRQLTQTQNT